MSSDCIKRYQYEISRKFVWWKPRRFTQADGRRDMTELNCHLVACKNIDRANHLSFEPSMNQWRRRGQGRWSWSHAVLILAVDKGDWLALRIGRFNPWKTATGWSWRSVCRALKRKICYPSRESNPEFSIIWPLKEVAKSTDLLMAGNGMFICRRLSARQI